MVNVTKCLWYWTHPQLWHMLDKSFKLKQYVIILVIINVLFWCFTSVITDYSEKSSVYVLYQCVHVYFLCLSLTVSNLKATWSCFQATNKWTGQTTSLSSLIMVHYICCSLTELWFEFPLFTKWIVFWSLFFSYNQKFFKHLLSST